MALHRFSHLWLLSFAVTVGSVNPVRAQGPARPPQTGVRPEPSKERLIQRQSKPGAKKQANENAKRDALGRLSLQIPSSLRARWLAKIEARIGRNRTQSKALRSEATQLLNAFLKEAPESAPEVPEALLRLAELQWESSRDDFLAKFQAWEKLLPEQRLNAEVPTPDYNRARQQLKRLLDRYPDFNNYDFALYIDGFLANEQSAHEEALARFNKILEKFPRSRFVADAHMVRAEYEFTKEAPSYETAYREYEEVLKHRDSGLYDLALFKSAWTLWRLGKADEAARRFLRVFRSTAEQGADSAGIQKNAEIDELQAEALRNLVTVFVEDEKNRAEDMYRFLVGAGGEKFATKIVRALADTLYEQSHYERGIEAYRLLLKLDPSAANAYEQVLEIARGHAVLEAWKELERDYQLALFEYVMPAHLKPGQAVKPWLLAQTPQTLERAEQAIETQLREDAVSLHAKAQSDKNSRIEFAGAARLYTVYLSRFAKKRGAYEAFYNLAEIYFYHLDDAVLAAEAYLAAARIDPNAKWSRAALYNALAALEVARSREFEASKAKNERPKESPTDLKLTEAMELYVKHYPGDSQIPELLFRQGKLYYDYTVYDPAVRQWGLLLERFPNSSYARGAGELILDSFNKSQDYRNIEVWARRLRTAPAFQSATEQGRLASLIVGAVFKQGEQLSQKADHPAAALAYLRAAKEFPKEPKAAEAAVNAIVEAQKAHDLGTLNAAVQELISHHKNQAETAEGIWVAANTHQEVGLFGQAADYHRFLADNFPKSPHHKHAAYNAVLLHAAMGEHAKAIGGGEKFRKLYPKDEAADEVVFLMGKAHEKAGKAREAAELYDRYARASKDAGSQIESLVRLAILRKNDEKAASSALDRALHIYAGRKQQLNDRGKYYAAQARYLQAQILLNKFDSIKIEGSVAELKPRLKKKGELLKKATEALLATAEVGVAEWTTAALYQVGYVYESFTQSLLNSPPPNNLNAAEQELYKQSIEEFIVPIEERSLEAYETGWKKALELNIFNSWTAKMREALGRLNQQLYPPFKEIGFALTTDADSALPPLITGPRRTKAGLSSRYWLPTSANAAVANGSKTP